MEVIIYLVLGILFYVIIEAGYFSVELVGDNWWCEKLRTYHESDSVIKQLIATWFFIFVLILSWPIFVIKLIMQ
jgi:hypothetical protein